MKFLVPFEGNFPITQTYDQHVARAKANGWCSDPDGNCSNGYYYGGIDWGIPTGTPIRASQSGTVSVAKKDTTGYGVHVEIAHEGGYLTVYGHMKKFTVAVGDHVNAGDQIGLSDNTGNSTGPHLHFECRLNKHPFNPAPWLVNTVEELGDVVTPPEPPTPDVGEPSTFPTLPRVKVIVDVLNVRTAPNTNGQIVNTLTGDSIVEVLRTVHVGNDVWIQIGYQEFSAQYYNGETYAKWLN